MEIKLRERSWHFWLVIALIQIIVIDAQRNHDSRRLLLTDSKIPFIDQTILFDPVYCSSQSIQPYRRGNWDLVGELAYNVDPNSVPMTCVTQHEFLLVAAAPLRSEDELWMAKNLGVPYKLYQASNLTSQYHHPNTAKEAMVYLKFISEHYDCLPEVTLFAHSHRERSWHRSTSLDEAVRSLNWQLVRDRGFAILHKQGMWFDQYVEDPERNLLGHEIDMGNLNFHRSDASPYKLPDDWRPHCTEVVNGTLYDFFAVLKWNHANWVRKAWTVWFQPAGLGPVPERIVFSAGAEFLVSRERIRSHPRQFYLDSMAFVEQFHNNEVLSSYELAVAFENIWHIIFGEDSIFRLTLDPCELHKCS